ncbi:hypothetical protein BD408DRAFT_448163 [Parasitella parasitica]|nr:hypothetical protein BD408DRAFT_448163 [Parasitella parasitica]
MPWPRRTCSPLPHQFGVEMAAPRSSRDIPPPPMWLLLLTPVSQQLKDIAGLIVTGVCIVSPHPECIVTSSIQSVVLERS